MPSEIQVEFGLTGAPIKVWRAPSPYTPSTKMHYTWFARCQWCNQPSEYLADGTHREVMAKATKHAEAHRVWFG